MISGGARGASWGDDDAIVFATNAMAGLWRVAAGAGEPEQITVPDSIREQPRWPELLPDGDSVLFTISNPDQDSIALLSLRTREWKTLLPGGSNPRYLPAGYIVYGVDGTLRAVAFDLRRLELDGTPVPVLDGVVSKDSGATNFALSADGSLVYIAGSPDSGVNALLAWVDRQGREELLSLPPRDFDAADVGFLFQLLSHLDTRQSSDRVCFRPRRRNLRSLLEIGGWNRGRRATHRQRFRAPSAVRACRHSR